MKGVLENSLFETQPHKFEHLNELARQFATIYCGNSIVKDNIFAVIENYARKKEIHLEILRFPIHDEELWAMTFLKKGTIFVCVIQNWRYANSSLRQHMNYITFIAMSKMLTKVI